MQRNKQRPKQVTKKNEKEIFTVLKHLHNIIFKRREKYTLYDWYKYTINVSISQPNAHTKYYLTSFTSRISRNNNRKISSTFCILSLCLWQISSFKINRSLILFCEILFGKIDWCQSSVKNFMMTILAFNITIVFVYFCSYIQL